MTSLKTVSLAATAFVTMTGQAIAADNQALLEQINQYSANSSTAQVNSIFQLSDVSPSDWAFDALRNLVENYNCIVGYPDGTYRGNRPLSRYEFAAGLNACLQQIERLITSGSSEVTAEDLAALRRLVNEFEAELATLGARVDDLEGRVEFLEDHQFSTTTKLVGEVSFNVSDAFGDDVEAQTVFQNKVRLTLVTSFTGKDRLYTRFTAGNSENSFIDEYGISPLTQEGRFAYDGESDNDVTIDRLHYVFPLGEKTTVTAMASLGGHHFYADTFNTGLEAGGGSNGALSRFGERNPIYRLGLGGGSTGIGIKHDFSDVFQISAGYLAKNGSNPTQDNGLFSGAYSALGQLVVKPSDRFKLGATYIRGFDTSVFDSNGMAPGNDDTFAFGGTGTAWANNLGNTAGDVESDTFGLQAQWDINDNVSLRGWVGYTNANFINVDAEADIWTWAGILALPDLGKPGNMGAIIVGSEPYATDLEVGGITPQEFTDDMPLHIEGLYKYQLSKNISITPGVIWLINPNQNEDNEDIIIGTIRTTFSF
ncbi:iron uptake porin [Picosynechococcus sp. NKBG042902]|uniref:iron uptake porin n=1 Tax=Picosynechococcus sp. NKBG042902 TaxID=490193 RepID=UPI0004ABACC0|nr:iron uptake porin [Picosynechococcus sp. NKBG042902]